MVTDLDEVNLRIVRFVSRYRLGSRSTIATLLPEGTQPDKRLSTLIKKGYLKADESLPGRRPLFRLTKKGAASTGVSVARSRLGQQALLKHLGVLYFCHVLGTHRHRVEREELGHLFGHELPDAAYCLCQVHDKTVVFDCYVPGPRTPVATVVRHLRKQLKVARLTPSLAQAVEDLRFGFAVIVHTAGRRKAIMDAVRSKQAGEAMAFIKRVRVWVEAIDELAVALGTALPRGRRVSAVREESLKARCNDLF